jgi:hypothetical protein
MLKKNILSVLSNILNPHFTPRVVEELLKIGRQLAVTNNSYNNNNNIIQQRTSKKK